MYKRIISYFNDPKQSDASLFGETALNIDNTKSTRIKIAFNNATSYTAYLKDLVRYLKYIDHSSYSYDGALSLKFSNVYKEALVDSLTLTSASSSCTLDVVVFLGTVDINDCNLNISELLREISVESNKTELRNLIQLLLSILNSGTKYDTKIICKYCYCVFNDFNLDALEKKVKKINGYTAGEYKIISGFIDKILQSSSSIELNTFVKNIKTKKRRVKNPAEQNINIRKLIKPIVQDTTSIDYSKVITETPIDSNEENLSNIENIEEEIDITTSITEDISIPPEIIINENETVDITEDISEDTISIEEESINDVGIEEEFIDNINIDLEGSNTEETVDNNIETAVADEIIEEDSAETVIENNSSEEDISESVSIEDKNDEITDIGGIDYNESNNDRDTSNNSDNSNLLYTGDSKDHNKDSDDVISNTSNLVYSGSVDLMSISNDDLMAGIGTDLVNSAFTLEAFDPASENSNKVENNLEDLFSIESVIDSTSKIEAYVPKVSEYIEIPTTEVEVLPTNEVYDIIIENLESFNLVATDAMITSLKIITQSMTVDEVPLDDILDVLIVLYYRGNEVILKFLNDNTKNIFNIADLDFDALAEILTEKAETREIIEFMDYVQEIFD